MFTSPPDPLRRLVLVAASGLIGPTRSQAGALTAVSAPAPSLERSDAEGRPVQRAQLRSELRLRDGWLLRHDDR